MRCRLSREANSREALVTAAADHHKDYTRLQHSVANLLIDVDGDRASIRMNLTASFGYEADPAPALVANMRYDVRAERTADGWRISEFAIKPVFQVAAPAHAA